MTGFFDSAAEDDSRSGPGELVPGTADTDYRGTVADAAREIEECLASGRDPGAAQVLVQVFADLMFLSADAVSVVVREAPGAVEPHWDAALAGIVELALLKRDLAVPGWTDSVCGDPSWVWDPWSFGRTTVVEELVPLPLRKRGVSITEAEITSA